ncbi:sarcosine oxidase subunit gamma [Maritalea mediterranea]|uniref:Sarcosine oxidase subunit gamma n=1 Tax=Maritalea mediterranea TaxID=2909667 RepID=A0ABS9E6H0_9HYPH|nr:sarcosine oxidase subunit gamma family protein [Maritalea mediterranea]MCF4098451.1 sarcosine oxidase subunit gamma [Maritalea mediterranea]
MFSDADSGSLKLDQGVHIGDCLRLPDQRFDLNLVDERSRFCLRVRETHVSAFAKASGLALPTQVGTTRQDENALIMCLSPDEWLIIAASESKDLIKRKTDQFKSAPFSLVDVSHRNVAFTLRGEGAAAMVNVGCPLDLDLKAFPVGKCTRTIFERAEIILYRPAETEFHIEVWRSFAPYVLSVLSNGAQAQ